MGQSCITPGHHKTWPLLSGFVCFSVAVINTMFKSNLGGGERVICLTGSRSQSIAEESQGRNSNTDRGGYHGGKPPARCFPRA